jgi:hypothetical protein
MSPTDNIVSFKGGKPLPEAEQEGMSEREDSIAYLATFLLDNKDTIKSFVCGVTIDVDATGDQSFHMLTSPIDIAEFALTLRFLEDGFRRYLPGADSE